MNKSSLTTKEEKMEQDKIYLGNNLDILKTFPDNSIDSIVTDPPYGINFMNKHWDYDVPRVELWKECLRVLKHGGHILVACGTRTQHRMAVNIEDAGFEIRDIIAWVYGSGFPKSKNVGLSIDKGEGMPNRGHRIAVANRNHPDGTLEPNGDSLPPYEAKTEQAKQWQGWGTALKPSMELWTLARKPLKGTVAQNVLEYGVGGLNIDGCRVETEEEIKISKGKGFGGSFEGGEKEATERITNQGRFPANLIHDGSKEVAALFPNTESGGGLITRQNDNAMFDFGKWYSSVGITDSGSTARFFYTAKASASERNMGLYGFETKKAGELQGGRKEGSAGSVMPSDGRINPYAGAGSPKHNFHPTVKPIDLMRYLCRLITPKGGLVLDPFIGSGTTGIAAKQEKMHYIGIEIDEQYLAIAEARIKAAVIEYDIFDFMEE